MTYHKVRDTNLLGMSFGVILQVNLPISLRSTPLLTALGNWETYAALNGGYGSDADRTPAVISRNKYHEYFDTPGDPNNPQYKDSYYRTDMGPITILTLDSTNGIPDESTKTKTFTGQVYSENDSVLKEEALGGARCRR